MIRTVRLGKEVRMLCRDPPPGIMAWPGRKEDDIGEGESGHKCERKIDVDKKLSLNGSEERKGRKELLEADRIDFLQVQLQGPEESPYEDGLFDVHVACPDRYPIEPPIVRFITKVFHPNIDGQGRICLDSLKMPPNGSWKPSLCIAQILLQVRLLLAEPNIDDPLVPEISDLYRNHREAFISRAREETRRYADGLKTVKICIPESEEPSTNLECHKKRRLG